MKAGILGRKDVRAHLHKVWKNWGEGGTDERGCGVAAPCGLRAASSALVVGEGPGLQSGEEFAIAFIFSLRQAEGRGVSRGSFCKVGR